MIVARRLRRRGSSMVAVFWLMAILALAVFAAVRVVSHDVDIVTSQIHGSQARNYAEMGVAVATHNSVKRDEPLLNQTFEDAGEGYSVRISSEAIRFNINAIIFSNQDDLLYRIFDQFGLEQKEIDPLIDALKDWIDGDDETLTNGAEEGHYLDQGQPNFPFNRPFYSVEEMRLVRGMTRLEEAQPNWRDWFTVFGVEGRLNINEAPAHILAIAAETTVEDAAEYLSVVAGFDGIIGTDDDQRVTDISSALADLNAQNDFSLLEDRFTIQDNSVRIESTGRSGGAKRRITLILANRTGNPRILSRKEEMAP